MKKMILITLMVFALIGCAAKAEVLTGLRLNMTKDEVVQVMGAPGSTSEKAGVLYLKYRLRNGYLTDDYYIRLIDDKVDAYGRFGEFGLGY
ncbi:hypothetical protein ACFLZL_02625 [Thermodesulfobacteriota bacterium]